jgi:hypothetical protein
MSKKNTIRVVVLAGLLAWPGVEYYRYAVAKQQLAASAELNQSVTDRLAAQQQLRSPLSDKELNPVIPASNPSSQPAKDSGGI